MSVDSVMSKVAEDGVVADLKGMWRQLELPAGLRRWTL
jgi:hypothetical protein